MKTVTATTTPTVVVASDADVDREIIVTQTGGGGGSPLRLSFNGSDSVIPPNLPFRFILPADEDLYMWVDTNTLAVGIIATKP